MAAGVLLLDCLSPVLAALGLEENHPSEVRRFLAAFDTLLVRAGIGEGASAVNPPTAPGGGGGAVPITTAPPLTLPIRINLATAPATAPEEPG